jgi:hypothetical protein
MINSVVQQASTFAIVTGFNKHTSFLCYGIYYGRNKFYDGVI